MYPYVHTLSRPDAVPVSWFRGAGRVYVIDNLGYRLEKALEFAHAETYNCVEYDDIVVHMKKRTEGLGADVAIDAVGAEADGNLLMHVTSAKDRKSKRLNSRH